MFRFTIYYDICFYFEMIHTVNCNTHRENYLCYILCTVHIFAANAIQYVLINKSIQSLNSKKKNAERIIIYEVTIL